ncbi:acetoin dehydrogenase dihydrolipoyllysine-residue acetyltransferase subunit [Acetobacteraceae bacterium H6797]|nr:acetoin dehydrogenase dihydrolipoyllysine-residue acetyltransferase subunit [Acetobacteraceae bacterium H6797]
MATEIILPRVDMDMATGRVGAWHVSDGETVEKGQPLFEIETDKAAMEIEAPASGTLRITDPRTGVEMPVGGLLAWILAPGEALPEAVAQEAARSPSETQAATTGTAAAQGPSEAPKAPAEPVAVQNAAPALAGASTAIADNNDTPRATPFARRLAEQAGIDLNEIAGSGPRGRIQARDVQEAAPAKAPETRGPALHTPTPLSGAAQRAWLRRGNGTPSLLVHGFGADLSSWRPLLAAAGEAGPVLAVDLPGHGRSPLESEPGLEALADAVEAAALAEGLDTVHLAGHSLGGAVATLLAARGRIGIRSLLLIAPAGLGPAMNPDFVAGFLRAEGVASLEPWLRLLFARPAALPASLAAATLRQRRENPAMVESQRRLAAALLPDGTQAVDIRPLLASLSMPVKLIQGLEDHILPWRQVLGLPGTLALHLFADTGHMPQSEQPQAVARLWAELRRAGTDLH